MFKATRGIVTGSAVGVSVLAAGTFVQFATATASAATRPSDESSARSAGVQHAKPAADLETPDVTTGCTDGSNSSPDYGCGKLTVDVQAVPGTYPATGVWDLAGLTFDISGEVANNDTEYDDATATCTTSSDPGGTGASCTESTGGTAPNGGSPETGTWIANDPYSVTLDTSGTNTQIPADTLLATTSATGNFPDCTAYQNTQGSGPSGCPDAVVFKAYGKYHAVALKVVNSITKKPIANVRYAICSPTSTTPVSSTAACPSGSTELESEVSSSTGVVRFLNVYAPSSNYSVVAEQEPTGYQAGRSKAINLPAVTTIAQAGSLVAATATLTPVKTTVVTHTVHTTENTPVTIDAFAHAKHAVTPLKLVKIGHVKHGSARHSGGVITFKPKHGFIGTVRFTYTVRNAVGASSTGTIVVHVKH
jgi:hypothetical protein